MALQPVKLDDLTWKGMVDAIRRRIPAASDGKWTLHAPVDPGITLLELFASQLEQRLYWMDQIPDTLSRGALRLLGTQAKSSRAATSVFKILAESFQAVPRHTEFTLQGSKRPIIFSTRTPMACLPFDHVGIQVDGVDRSTDLAHGKIFHLFPCDGSAAEIGITLNLLHSLPAEAAGKWIGLFFQLRTSEAIPPQWSSDAAVGVNAAAQLTFFYRSTSDELAPYTPQNVDDGTGGFRRSGVIRLRIPEGWRSEPITTPQGVRYRYAIVIRTDAATFSVPPRLVSLVPNAVLVRHAHRTKLHSLQQARAWLPLPGNELALDVLEEDPSKRNIPPMERSVLLQIRERADRKWHWWRPTDDFYRHGPGDRVFVVDRQKMRILFGDGLTGRLPILPDATDSEPDIKIRYVAGGGAAGAVSIGGDWKNATGLSALCLVAGTGGIDTETLEQAGQRAAAEMRQPTRAVTQLDFEEIALSTAGIALRRAHAAIGYYPPLPCVPVMGVVTVFVVPDAPREELDEELVESAFVAAPMPDVGALAAVRSRLDKARLITSQAFVSAPHYRAVSLDVQLQGCPADPAAIQHDIKKRLQDFLDPLIGGDNKNGWRFGGSLHPSVLLREAQQAIENRAKVVEVAIGLDGHKPAEACREVSIGAHELVWLKQVTFKLERLAQPGGGLR